MAMVAEVEREGSLNDLELDHIEKTKTLICALNLLSRNIPLPPDVFDAVSSIYLSDNDDESDAVEGGDGASGSDADAIEKVLVSLTFLVGMEFTIVCRCDSLGLSCLLTV